MNLTLTLLASLLLVSGPQDVGKKPQDAAAPKDAIETVLDDDAIIAMQLPSYPLTTCPVSGEKLGSMGDPIDVVVDQRLIRLCCKGCVKPLGKDATGAIAKIDEGVVRAQKADYPMDVCAISGEKLGSMGDPIEYVHGTRLVRFCCKGCVKGFEKDPKKSMADLDRAYIAKLTPKYTMKECLVSGEALGSMGEPVDVLYGTQLVRLCCRGCVKGFHKEPAKYVAKLTPAKETKLERKPDAKKGDGLKSGK
ncbi:MAG: hypothetical protein GY711_01865 [bacterium]|nr:hypothetical protein [bacterium]